MRSPFSIILIMCILMVIGVCVFPRLDISNEPRPEQGKTLTISYSWRNASAKVIEQNVTSRIEALVAAVKGVEKISSVSRFGNGRITVEMKPKADVSMAKFEIASILRQVKDKLPEDVSFPVVTGGEVNTGIDGNEVKQILTYQINADMSGEQMKQVVERMMGHSLEKIDGVHHVDITGATSHYMEIAYDADEIAAYGISASDIIDAVRNYTGREDVIGEVTTESGRITIPLVLTSKERQGSFEAMPLKNIGGKTVYMNNLTQCSIREKQPDSYFRINGQNTLYINIYAEKDANTVRTADKVKDVMSATFGNAKGLSCEKSYDRAETEMKEFRTLILRSSLTLVILLIFVWFAGGRRWKYLCIISVSLLANILSAIVIYWLMDIRLHPMSLAGITVSLGIIIDSSIVMADHYAYYRNRKALLGIMAAMLTTIGSLVIVFWLPDFLRHDLKDFSIVVMINLAVAILVASFFAPALVEKLQFTSRKSMVKRNRRTRFVISFSRCYAKYVSLCQHRIGRWAMLLLFACLFGGTLKLFISSLDSNTYRPKRDEMQLSIRAQMPVGGSVQELNEKVKEVEAFLTQFDEIKRFETSVRSRGASIMVEFKKEALQTGFPYMLENKVIGKVITIGGADWATSGVSDRGFSNFLNLQYRANSIEIAGYDYERLYRFAEDMCRELRRNNRVVDIAIQTPGHEEQENEYFMEYDNRTLAIDSVSPYDVHSAMQRMLSQRDAGEIELQQGSNGKAVRMPVQIKPSTVETYDIWKLRNSYINAGGRTVRPSGFMSINQREAKNVIPRENQEYILRVAFNVLGSYAYTDRYIKRITKQFNDLFPIGFRCLNKTYGAYEDNGTQYWLIGLVAVIIFFVLSIMLESMLQALAITMLIPVSFIGLFLTYHLTGIPFGTGGFAAMVLLAGLTVNAGIYIICHYNIQGVNGIKAFVRAFNHKIIPILLTILSTVLGMIPFLIDGPDAQPFWYSLAVGTIGGLSVSFLWIFSFLPIVMNRLRGEKGRIKSVKGEE